METKKKITLGIGGVIIILMGSSLVMDMFSKPTTRTAPVTPKAVVNNTSSFTPESIEVKTVQPLVLELSDNANTLLNALDSTYLSTVNTQANEAKIKELEKQKQLDDLVFELTYGERDNPEPEKNYYVQPVKAAPSIIDRLQVNSIINDTAFIYVSGQVIPVKKGDNVEDAKITRITKNTVVLTRNNQSFTKYIKAAPIKVAIKKESEDVRSQ